MPWRQAGLNERQAAAHLLSRFTYGARPGDVGRVLARGPERWMEDQLAAAAPEPDLSRRLAALRSLPLSAEAMASTYPSPGLLLAQARRDGVLPAREGAGEQAAAPRRDGDPAASRPRRDPALRDELLRFVAEKGYRRQGELIGDLLTQKLLRAVYAENQLAEAMADFWFNHFNVSITDPQSRVYVLAYERDAIRPHALGRFADLLGATARHPAMLLYLDNARSVAAEGAATTLAARRGGAAGGFAGGPGRGAVGAGGATWRGRGFSGRGAGGFSGAGRRGDAPRRGLAARDLGAAVAARRPTGINENYARELLELHTLGVDGGYGQQDVVEVARAFTGWTVVPPRRLLGERSERRLVRLDGSGLGRGLGFLRDGQFLFRPDTHDAGAKTVLGSRLPAGRGIEDGEQVLALLADHPATARHLAAKLAARFVADEPPPALVDRLAVVFRQTRGDVPSLLRALVRSPELWAAAAREQKVKSPFELAASALRALDADLASPAAVVDWVARMGQPLYAQQAPTGWPDRAEAWVNGGSLLARMNFGLALASGRLSGVRFDLAPFGAGAPAAAAESALAASAARLLPERELGTALDRLAALVREPGLDARLAAEGPATSAAVAAMGEMAMTEQRLGRWMEPFPEYRRDRSWGPADSSTAARVVGVLLGSPEFQRR